MSTYSILILNGPNLGALGIRQPEIYGTSGIDAIPGSVADLLGEKSNRVDLSMDQCNGEGQMLDRLELARKDGVQGIALNAGAYTHTSLALADCLAWIGIPTVEVHVSNVFARPEAIRQQSYMAAHVIGVISGFGITGYGLAVQALIEYLDSHK